MKSITFSIEESTIIEQFLTQRLNDLIQEGTELYPNSSSKKRFLNNLLSALDKIKENEPSIYNKREKIVFISCINENIDDFYNNLKLPENYKEQTISAETYEIAIKIDTCKDILCKCDYYKNDQNKHNIEFRYKNVLKYEKA